MMLPFVSGVLFISATNEMSRSSLRKSTLLVDCACELIMPIASSALATAQPMIFFILDSYSFVNAAPLRSADRHTPAVFVCLYCLPQFLRGEFLTLCNTVFRGRGVGLAPKSNG